MARPIIPVAVKRFETGSTIEVLSRSGIWMNYRLLSGQSQFAVEEACAKAGYKKRGVTFPNCWFEWNLAEPADEEGPQVRPYPDEQQPQQFESETETESSDSDSTTESDEPSDMDDKPSDEKSEEETDQDSGPNKEEDEVTIEDIIRKIAGELDDTVRTEVADAFGNIHQEWKDELSNQLADFKSQSVAPTDVLRSVITTINIVEPTKPTVQLDGIFHAEFPELLQNCRDGLHTYLPGPPGAGKSHAAESVATAMGWRFASMSCGPTTPESRIWGGMDANGKFFEPAFVQGCRYAMANPDSGFIWCLDEMDNGHPGILSTQNSAMANGWFTAPNGDRIVLGRNVVFVGAANTFGTGPTAEFAGRNKLDPATLDRFTYVPWDTDLGMEAALVRNYLPEDLSVAWLDVWQTVRNNVADHGLKFFVTMRGCLNGARIIAGGRTIDKALALVLGNKIPTDQWAKVNPL